MILLYSNETAKSIVWLDFPFKNKRIMTNVNFNLFFFGHKLPESLI